MMLYLHEYIPIDSKPVYLVSSEIDAKDAAIIAYTDNPNPATYTAYNATLWGDYWRIDQGTKEEMEKRKFEEEELDDAASGIQWRYQGDIT